MDTIFEEDQNVQHLIQRGVDALLTLHELEKQKIILQKKQSYIRNQVLLKYETKLFETLVEDSKNRDPYIRFIKEKIEPVYIHSFKKDKKKAIDEDVYLNIRMIYPHYKKWYETNYPHIPVHSFVQSLANFQVSGRLGPMSDPIKGWIGLRIKKIV
jgi:hypothetical protein